MSFSRKYQLETERKNDLVIKTLQKQGDLPKDAPWEHVSPQTGMPLLEKYQCEIAGCGRLTWKFGPRTVAPNGASSVIVTKMDGTSKEYYYSPLVLATFTFGTNDALNRCHSCAKRAGINRQL
ncbi:MAG: hypothetical protein CMP53_09145 [Flavobacteriales bacterium]|nr:hypothetical protein [Flavobacteriales bacterium]|tara:strand:- start:915 stop:1283 length:369 start_codon:yes stop_codon:yes gene_type:complete